MQGNNIQTLGCMIEPSYPDMGHLNGEKKCSQDRRTQVNDNSSLQY